MVLRDRDSDANGTLDERVYPLFDANFNVSSIVDDEGAVLERYRYEPYGDRVVLNADFTPDTLAGSDSTTADDTEAGWNMSDVLFRHGHQGGAYDRVASEKMLFRFRTLDTQQMRWGQVDPLRYVDGMNAYTAVRSNPIRLTDPSGLLPMGLFLLPGMIRLTTATSANTTVRVAESLGALDPWSVEAVRFYFSPTNTTGVLDQTVDPQFLPEYLSDPNVQRFMSKVDALIRKEATDAALRNMKPDTSIVHHFRYSENVDVEDTIFHLGDGIVFVESLLLITPITTPEGVKLLVQGTITYDRRDVFRYPLGIELPGGTPFRTPVVYHEDLRILLP